MGSMSLSARDVDRRPHFTVLISHVPGADKRGKPDVIMVAGHAEKERGRVRDSYGAASLMVMLPPPLVAVMTFGEVLLCRTVSLTLPPTVFAMTW